MRVIRSRNLWVRSAGMCLLGMAILFLTWTLSYRALPEGAVQGKLGVYYVPIKTEDAATTFIRIFLWNLLVGCIPIIAANFLQIKGFPIGYILALYHWAMYGILLGTNSFIIPGPGRFLPSLTTLFYGSGIYEITAYTLISSATYNLHVYDEGSFSKQKILGKRKWSELKLSKAELGLIIFAILILAIANYFEAWNIFHR
ncbi:MAG: hypothetical protein QW222_02200 [Candidatus Bathyarchaeia archaeon]